MANPHRVTVDTLEGTGFYEAIDAQDFDRAQIIRQPIREAQEHERLKSLEQEAKSIAEEAQAAIGEAYQSPFTRETALHAARIALGITRDPTQEGEA